MTTQRIRLFRRIAVLGFAVFSSVVHAGIETVCASNAADIVQAMAQHSDSGALHASALNLRLKANTTYKVGNPTANAPFTYINTGPDVIFELSGNWNADCSEQAMTFPTSILDGNQVSAVMTVDNDYGGIFIDHVIVQGGKTTHAGAGLAINAQVQYGSFVSVTYSVIRNNTTTGLAGGVLIYSTNHSGTDVYTAFYQNLITANHADLDFGAGSVHADNISNGGNPVVMSNVVYGNTSNADGGLQVSGTGNINLRPYVSCNVFRGNTNSGLVLDGNGAFLSYNAYGMRGGVTPYSEIGTVTAAPMFVDAASGDFHLAQGSPLIGAVGAPGGGYCIAGADLDGHARVYASISDMGVFAETIFGSGFDG